MSTASAGEKLTYRYTAQEDGQNLRRYDQRVPGLSDQGSMHERQGAAHHPLEHEHVVRGRADTPRQNPQRCVCAVETVEHPFATLKMRMGATHFLDEATEERRQQKWRLNVSATPPRVMNIVGVSRCWPRCGLRPHLGATKSARADHSGRH